MASDHWRDLHRNLRGGFVARPGKKVFKADPNPGAKPPPTDASSTTKTGKGLFAWVQKNRSQ